MFDDTTDTDLLVTGIGRKVKRRQKALIMPAATLPNISLDLWFWGNMSNIYKRKSKYVSMIKV